MKRTNYLSLPTALIAILVGLAPTTHAEGVNDPTPCAEGLLAPEYFDAANVWREASLVALEHALALVPQALNDPPLESAFPRVPSTVETYRMIGSGESKTLDGALDAPACLVGATGAPQDGDRIANATIAALAPYVQKILAMFEPVPDALFGALHELDCKLARLVDDSACTSEP